MIKKLTIALAFASVAGAGMTPMPAAAQSYYDRGEYHQAYQDEGDNNDDRGYYQRRGYEQDSRYQNYREQQAIQEHRARYARHHRGYQGYYDRGAQGYAYRNDYPQQRTYYRGQRCKSGTTGAILGALAGGLLGREIGRGGEYNEPSTTGLLLGAGGGALAGRAIERSGNDCR